MRFLYVKKWFCSNSASFSAGNLVDGLPRALHNSCRAERLSYCAISDTPAEKIAARRARRIFGSLDLKISVSETIFLLNKYLNENNEIIFNKTTINCEMHLLFDFSWRLFYYLLSFEFETLCKKEINYFVCFNFVMWCLCPQESNWG